MSLTCSDLIQLQGRHATAPEHNLELYASDLSAHLSDLHELYGWKETQQNPTMNASTLLRLELCQQKGPIVHISHNQIVILCSPLCSQELQETRAFILLLPGDTY